MKLIYSSNDIRLENSNYYSPNFNILRELLTIQIETPGVSTVTVESSVDGEEWFPVPSCEFITGATGGLQSYVECQTELLYRIKSTLLPTELIILL